MNQAPDANEGPRTVVDPSTGRPILLAPVRQRRPMHTGSRKDEARCPFCLGHEADTPPTLDAAPADGLDWRARAFSNKYPAALHHDVIAEGGPHHEHPCELDRDTLRAAVHVWRRRIAALEATPGIATAYLFKNVGARAGASIAHNHSQVIGLDRLPPRLELELQQQRALGACQVCAALCDAERDGRLVYQNERFAVVTPEPSKLPYESWLVPSACGADATSFVALDEAGHERLVDALHAWFGALDAALGRPPLNLWLHRVPKALLDAGEHFHWHFELQPRTGQVAGLELGGDMYINSVPATLAAARLRDGLAGSGHS